MDDEHLQQTPVLEIHNFLKQLSVFEQKEVLLTDKEKQKEKSFEETENEFNLRCVEF